MADNLVVLRCPSCNAEVSGPGTCTYCGAEIQRAEIQREAPVADEPTTFPSWVDEARAQMAAGRKIQAIKLAREHTGLGLRDAKELVESGDLDDPVKVSKLPQVTPPAKTARSEASCFPATAEVGTPAGSMPIGQLKRGDEVWGWDRSGRLCASRVTAVLMHPPTRLWSISFTGDEHTIETTRNHSFLTTRGWLRVDRLEDDDVVIAPDGLHRVVASVLPTDTVAVVYNLHTSGPHNFVVDGVVVHNFTTLRTIRSLFHRWFLDRVRLRIGEHGGRRSEPAPAPVVSKTYAAVGTEFVVNAVK